jgi:hypothetical protein
MEEFETSVQKEIDQLKSAFQPPAPKKDKKAKH